MECFAALGLEPTASLEEVKLAYRNKARQLHPDLGGDRQEFETLQEHYKQSCAEVAARKCPDCAGTRKIQHTVGWSTIDLPCPLCG